MNRGFIIALGLLAFQVLMANGAAGSAASPSLLEMGYSPSALFPTNEGAPVYTAGDQLWARSDLGQTVELSVGPGPLSGNPSGTNYTQILYPGVPARIHVFSLSDPEGLWYAGVINSTLPSVNFLLTDQGHKHASMILTGSRLLGGSLVLNYSVDPRLQFYDAKVCAFGTQDTATARLHVPAGLGGGELGLTWNGSAVAVLGSGLGNDTFILSLELFHSYSFLTPRAGSTLVTRNIPVAESNAVAFSNRNSLGEIDLVSDVVQRVGRYLLRAVFEGAGGTSIVETQLLMTENRQWVWLGQCTPSFVDSNDFRYSVPLGTDPSVWPRQVYFLYRVNGVEGYAISNLGLNITGAQFIGAPWGAKLAGYTVSATVTGASSQDVANGTIYAIGGTSSSALTYSLSLGNQTFFRGALAALPPFTFTDVSLNVSRLIVSYQDNGVAVDGAEVTVSNANGTLTRTATGRDGFATMYLPPGRYDLEGASGNTSSVQSVVLVRGESLVVSLGNTGTGTLVQSEVFGLSVLAGAGLLLNLLVAFRRRRRRSRLTTGSPRFQPKKLRWSTGPRHPAQ